MYVLCAYVYMCVCLLSGVVLGLFCIMVCACRTKNCKVEKMCTIKNNNDHSNDRNIISIHFLRPFSFLQTMHPVSLGFCLSAIYCYVLVILYMSTNVSLSPYITTNSFYLPLLLTQRLEYSQVL